jgi:hypothetical protein
VLVRSPLRAAVVGNTAGAGGPRQAHGTLPTWGEPPVYDSDACTTLSRCLPGSRRSVPWPRCTGLHPRQASDTRWWSAPGRLTSWRTNLAAAELTPGLGAAATGQGQRPRRSSTGTGQNGPGPALPGRPDSARRYQPCRWPVPSRCWPPGPDRQAGARSTEPRRRSAHAR